MYNKISRASKLKSVLSKALFGTAFILASAGPASAAPKTYELDPAHAYVVWHASHFGFATAQGIFALPMGKLVIDENNVKDAKVNVTIDLNKLHTGNPEFDGHLKSAGFFDVDQYPTATFESTKVVRTGGKKSNEAMIHGLLTLHGHKGPVVIKAKLVKKGINPFNKKETLAFDGTTTIKRSLYGMKNMVDMGISDDVKITISAEFALPVDDKSGGH